ncbi:MAG: hypothetical protein IJG97_03260 [Bacilli bacterium]|nr:hypothetical protein [Bacilli bacterium]
MEEKNENVELNNEQSAVEPVVESTVSTETAEPVVEPTVPVESAEPATPVVEPAPVVETNDLPAGNGMASGNDVAAPVTESKTETMEPIMDPEKKGKKSTTIIIIVAAVLALICLLVFVLPSILMNKKNIVTQEVNTVFKNARLVLEKADKNKLQYNLEKDVLGLEGSVSFDSDYKDSSMDLTKLKDYKITYSGAIDKAGNKANFGLKLDGSKNILDVNGMMKEKNVYLKLGDLYDKTITTITEQEIKDLEISSVTAEDIELLLSKTETVLKENIKDENITKEKVEKEIDGKKGSYQKVSHKIDVNDYTKKLLEAYQSDSEVIDVLARISNQKDSDIKDLIKSSLDSLKDAKKEEMTVNLYLGGLIAKTKEVEVLVDGGTLIIDVDNNLYKYKMLADSKELFNGTFDKAKREFTLIAKEGKASTNATVTFKDDNHVVGTVSVKDSDVSMDVNYDLVNKVSGKSQSVDAKATINYKEGDQKFNLSINSNSKITVGGKVEEINPTNTIDAEKLTDNDMMTIYSKFMTKVQPVIKEIAPGYLQQ